MNMHRYALVLSLALCIPRGGLVAADSIGLVSGQVYRITAKCSANPLDVEGASTSDGATVRQWSGNGTLAQQWRVVSDSNGNYTFVAQCSSKLLSFTDGDITDGAIAMQWSDLGTNNQRWTITPYGDGWLKIINKATGKSLDVNGASSAVGARVQQWTPNGTDAQRWRFVRVESATLADAVSPGLYQLTAKHSGMALDVSGASSAEGARVQQWSPNLTGAQKWDINTATGGGSVLKARCSNKVLSVTGASTNNGTALTQLTDAGAQHQRWQFSDVGSNYVTMTSCLSGRLADVSGVSMSQGTEVIQWDRNGGDNQKWKLTRQYPNIQLVAGETTFVVAQDDIVTITSSVTGATSSFEACGVAALPTFSVSPGTTFTPPTATAGDYTYLTVSGAGQEVSRLHLLVVSTTLQTQVIADEINFGRSITVQVKPAGAPVTFRATDPATLEISTPTYAGDTVSFVITSLNVGAQLVAQIDGPEGRATIARRKIDAFTVSTTANDYIGIVETLADGSTIAQATLTMAPFVPDLTIRMRTIVSGVFFEDSTTSKDFASNSMTLSGGIGSLIYRLLRYPDGHPSFCHGFTVFQGSTQVSR